MSGLYLGSLSWNRLADGFRLPESLRWRDSQLWMSDMDGGVVNRIGPAGLQQVCTVPAQPSGLGWDPDGALLVVSQLDARLLRLTSDGFTIVADLLDALRSGGGDVRPNDMHVGDDGTAYIGSVSFEVVGDRLLAEDSRPTPVLRVSSDGDVAVLSNELKCPNGIVADTSGRGLYVAETRANRIVRLGWDGAVTSFADCPAGPDGLSLDSSGRVWAAYPFAGLIQCLDDTGAVVAEVPTPGRMPLDCAVGGSDGRTLFVASVEVIDHLGTARTGSVESCRSTPIIGTSTRIEMEDLR